MRPGSFADPNLVYLTYFAGGLRAYDISDAGNPVEVAHLVPPAPPGRDSISVQRRLCHRRRPGVCHR